MGKGFEDETRYTPQNFEWTVSDESKVRILETSSTSGVYTDGSHRAYKITLKNIWNQCRQSNLPPLASVVVTCRFKDEFNNNLTPAQGYDTVHSMTVYVSDINLVNQVLHVDNGNFTADHAWDNELWIPEQLPVAIQGKNYSPDSGRNGVYWQGQRAKNQRRKTSFDKQDEEEIRVKSTLSLLDPTEPGFTSSKATDNNVYEIRYQWEKLIDSTWTPINSDSQADVYFHLVNGAKGLVGSFESYFSSDGSSFPLNSQRCNNLHIQSSWGTGTYRSTIQVRGDSADPWVCRVHSNSVNVTIHWKPSSFDADGAAYVCKSSAVSEIIVNQPSHAGKRMRYSLYRRNGTSLLTKHVWTLVGESTTGRYTFSVPSWVPSAYFTVKATQVLADGVRPYGGIKWSNSHLVVQAEWQHSLGVPGNKESIWYNNTTLVRRLLDTPNPPNIALRSRTGANREVLSIGIQFNERTAPRWHVFDDIEWKIDAIDVDGFLAEAVPWTTIDVPAGGETVLNTTVPIGSTINIYSRSIYSGSLAPGDVKPGQWSARCPSSLASEQTYTINCAQVSFIAPGGTASRFGFTGDNQWIREEVRDILNDDAADSIVLPTAPLVVSSRSRDQSSANIGLSFDNKSDGYTLIEVGLQEASTSSSDRWVSIGDYGNNTIELTPTSVDNSWVLEIKQSWTGSGKGGQLTPSGLGFPTHLWQRRINK